MSTFTIHDIDETIQNALKQALLLIEPQKKFGSYLLNTLWTQRRRRIRTAKTLIF